VPSDTAPPGTAPTDTISLDPTNPQPSDPSQEAFLPVRNGGGFCQVGPAGGSGEVFSRGSAAAEIVEGGWGVVVELASAGEPTWNTLASQCFSRAETCPTAQIAIELDGEIQSAPVVQTPTFSGAVTISGSFTEGEARELARVLRRGAFPVSVEAQTVQTISPTLGKDSLRAAVIAGIVGIVLVLAFLVAYYRRLAIAVVGGLLVWGALVWSLATIVSNQTNYTLSLAGATGVIVAVGITVDTYVVFFERLKDEVRSGRTLRNSALRGFKSTWRTIVTADLVSLIAAVVLFWLSVGSVKGFALYLGLTTICDLLVCYFVTRPLVVLLSRTKWFEGRRVLGLGATA
jgi:preprotein translocase subunit SecD